MRDINSSWRKHHDDDSDNTGADPDNSHRNNHVYGPDKREEIDERIMFERIWNFMEETEMKIVTADKVKKLPVGTDVYLVRNATGEKGLLYVVKSGRKKMLRGMTGLHEIKDRAGWHYGVEE